MEEIVKLKTFSTEKLMIKRLIAILACIALLAVCLTACGGKDEDETPAGSNAVAESVADVTTVVPSSESGGADPEAVGGGGRDPYVSDLDDWY